MIYTTVSVAGKIKRHESGSNCKWERPFDTLRHLITLHLTHSAIGCSCILTIISLQYQLHRSAINESESTPTVAISAFPWCLFSFDEMRSLPQCKLKTRNDTVLFHFEPGAWIQKTPGTNEAICDLDTTQRKWVNKQKGFDGSRSFATKKNEWSILTFKDFDVKTYASRRWTDLEKSIQDWVALGTGLFSLQRSFSFL